MRRPQRLRECLQSLAAQTFRNFELVLVDMSGGLSSTTVEEMRECLPALRHLKLNAARSRPAALNRGIESAEGNLITILDDDNLWDPDHLRNIARDFNDADLVYTSVRVQTFTAAGEMMHERIHQLPFDFSRLLEGNFIFTVATAFRRSLWDDVGRYDERFPVYEDWEFLIRATHGRKVRALTCCSTISRAFTGDLHLREHSANEADDCARCHAALQWKHRGLRKQRLHDFKNMRLIAQWWWQNRFAPLRA